MKKVDLTALSFKENDLLYEVAKVSVPLAEKIAKDFGGQYVYILKLDTIQRPHRDAYIVAQRGKLVGNQTLSRELNLSVSQLRLIHKRRFKEKK
tara:strand:+ start:25 stop:306 length:282 start_codon:yes stop_codon:yes gene_type:complete